MELIGFREGDVDLFSNITYTPTNREQESPFVLIKHNGDIKEIKTIDKLLDNAKPDEWVLVTWVGKWKSDVFKFKCSDLERYIENNNQK